MPESKALPQPRPRLGLIVNPMAGLGGRVGLKGSDGDEIQRLAVKLGATPRALDRAAEALAPLRAISGRIDIVTCPGAMGETVTARCGFSSFLVRSIGGADRSQTTAEDTKAAAREMRRAGVDLLLFVGGDGTARDVYDAVGERQVVLGIPAGVKIHSAAYAVGPAAAATLASAFLGQRKKRTRKAEVLDADEDAIRQGVVCTTLHGVLRVPDDTRRLQGAKAGGGAGTTADAAAIARRIIRGLDDDTLYVVGPGTTTQTVFELLDLDKTLLGVDVLRGRRLIASDVGETRLLDLISEGESARIVVTPIGGQGYLFGRGNQQISPDVLRRVGCENVIVIATAEKLNRLMTRPLLVDIGDAAIDQSLAGHVRVICGPDDDRVMRVAAVANDAPDLGNEGDPEDES